MSVYAGDWLVASAWSLPVSERVSEWVSASQHSDSGKKSNYTVNLQNVHYGLIGIFTQMNKQVLSIKLRCLPSPTPPPRNNFVYLADGLQLFTGYF